MVCRKGRLVLRWKAACLVVSAAIFLSVADVSRADVLGERHVNPAGVGRDSKVASPSSKTEAPVVQESRTATAVVGAPAPAAVAPERPVDHRPTGGASTRSDTLSPQGSAVSAADSPVTAGAKGKEIPTAAKDASSDGTAGSAESPDATTVPSGWAPLGTSASMPTRARGEVELEHWVGGVWRGINSLPENSAIAAAVKSSPERVRVRGNEFWRLRGMTGPVTTGPETESIGTAGPALPASPMPSASAGAYNAMGDGGAQEPSAVVVAAPAPAAVAPERPVDHRPTGGASTRSDTLSPQGSAASAADSPVTAGAKGKEIPTAAKDASSDGTAGSAESPDATTVPRDMSEEALNESPPTTPPVISQQAAGRLAMLTLGSALMLAGLAAHFLWTRFARYLPEKVAFWDD